MAFSIANDAKFSSLFHLIGQISTNLDHLAPADSINETFTQMFCHSGTLNVAQYCTGGALAAFALHLLCHPKDLIFVGT